MSHPQPLTARQRSQQAQLTAIQTAAIDLTLAQGLDGFTMDDLAHRTGLSRRTVFNRVGDKMSAVLGPSDNGHDIRLDSILDRAGSPFDALARGVVAWARALEVDETSVELNRRMREAVAREPRLAEESSRRARETVDAVAEEIRDHEGWTEDDARPRVLARVLGDLLDEAMGRAIEKQVAGQRADVVDEFEHVVAAFRAVVQEAAPNPAPPQTR